MSKKNQNPKKNPVNKKSAKRSKPTPSSRGQGRRPRSPRISRPSPSRDQACRLGRTASPWMADSIDEWPMGNRALRFTPYAWAKLVYFCHAGETEIGGFGLSDPDDPLLVTDLLTLKQTTTSVSVDFDDEAVADLFEQQVDQGRHPEHFARIWCHTHPGNSAEPSSVDETTFVEAFGRCDWAVMFILAKGGQTYARMRFSSGPGGEMLMPVTVAYEQSFNGSDHHAWAEDFARHVHPETGDPLGGALDLWADCASSLLDPVDGALLDPCDLDLDQHDQIEHLMAAYGIDDPDELQALLEMESNTSYDEVIE